MSSWTLQLCDALFKVQPLGFETCICTLWTGAAAIGRSL
jgi:hypothetical protein